MNENIKKFLEKAEQSPELQAKFSKIRDPEEAYKLAASVQDGFTKEEFISEMKKLYDEAIKDLSDEDIAKVAGGSESTTEALISYLSPGLSAGTVVASALTVSVKVVSALSSAAV